MDVTLRLNVSWSRIQLKLKQKVAEALLHFKKMHERKIKIENLITLVMGH